MFSISPKAALLANRMLQWMIGVLTVAVFLVGLSYGFEGIFAVIGILGTALCLGAWRVSIAARKGYKRGDRSGREGMNLFGLLAAALSVLMLIALGFGMSLEAEPRDPAFPYVMACLLVVTMLGLLCAMAVQPKTAPKKSR